VTAPVFTIGHSVRPLEDFLALLAREGVAQLADVRAFPTSRRHPHYDREALGEALSAAGLRYSHHPDLGGRRAPRPDSPNGAWRNRGFRGYADYMQTPEFAAALARLLDLASLAPTAVMCAEAVPWRCHRSLIADALVARGEHVVHILEAGSKPHSLTRFAVVRDGSVIYPTSGGAERQEELFPG
jgi:uncharacterized protein (DUF488 family)